MNTITDRVHMLVKVSVATGEAPERDERQLIGSTGGRNRGWLPLSLMHNGFRSPRSVFLLLGLMAVLVTPRGLLHHCEAHDPSGAFAGEVLHGDETCAVCQAVVGHAPHHTDRSGPLALVPTELDGAALPRVVCRDLVRAFVTRGPPVAG